MMRLLKRLLILTLAINFSNNLFSQDAHFSLYDASPIYYNPALTGLGPCDHRFMLNSKLQWNTYQTFTFSYDLMLPDKIQNVLPAPFDGDWAAGIMVMSDQSGEVSHAYNMIKLFPAYHKNLPLFGHYVKFSSGLDLSLLQKSFDVDASIIGYEPDGTPIKEYRDTDPTHFVFGASGGANIGTKFKDKYPFNLGLAFHHFYTKTPSNYEDDGEIMPRRISAITNFEIPLDTSNSKQLIPSAIFVYQNPGWEGNVGSLFWLNTASISQLIPGVYVGAFCRLTNSPDEVESVATNVQISDVIAAAGFDFSLFKKGEKVNAESMKSRVGDFRVLFAYDITTSLYNDMVTKGYNNSIELSIQYTFCNKSFEYTPPFKLNPVFN